jgi:hypothetical protein
MFPFLFLPVLGVCIVLFTRTAGSKGEERQGSACLSQLKCFPTRFACAQTVYLV